MKMQRLIVAALATLWLAGPSHAQTKKEWVQKVLQLQQPSIEAIGQQLVEQPANALLQRAGLVVQGSVAPEQREALAKDLHATARKFADENAPLLRKRAVELAPATIGPLLEQKFSEDELKQLHTMLSSPVFAKYQQLGSEMQKALASKLVAETRTTVEPKVRALEQQIAQKLQAAPKAAAASAPAPAPAAAPKK